MSFQADARPVVLRVTAAYRHVDQNIDLVVLRLDLDTLRRLQPAAQENSVSTFGFEEGSHCLVTDSAVGHE